MKISKITIYIGWFFLGFLTPLVIFIAVVILGLIPPTDAQLLVSKWHIFEENPNKLHIAGSDQHNVPILIGVELDPQNELIKEVGFVRNVGKEEFPLTMGFSFEGKFDLPMFFYGDPYKTVLWKDFNGDGWFDQMWDFKKRLMNINIDSQWVNGIKSDNNDEVLTDKGIFVFDPNAGNWVHLNSGN